MKYCKEIEFEIIACSTDGYGGYSALLTEIVLRVKASCRLRSSEWRCKK